MPFSEDGIKKYVSTSTEKSRRLLKTAYEAKKSRPRVSSLLFYSICLLTGLNCLQIQDVIETSSYDAAGSFLLLGGSNGSIYYVGK